MSYARAVAELYQAPLASFVADRKRLAGELKAAGDKEGAAALGKLARPTSSAWAVNQLWWHARDAFDALLESADKLRKGDLRASAGHRDALAKLRARAAAMLKDAGHGATEATLRRVTQTLSAIAASGGWDPDPPGAIAADREAPGFEVPGLQAGAKVVREDAKPQHDGDAAAKKREKERLAAERHRLDAALRTAKGDVRAREHDVVRLEKELDKAKRGVETAQEIVDDLERKLGDLAN
jgi:hypothetical protein